MRFYDRLPPGVQDIVCTVKGAQIQRVRYGGNFAEMLRTAEDRMGWDLGRLSEWRDKRLSSFVAHAARYTTYYRNLFDEYGIDVDSIHGADELQRLPILTKSEVVDHATEFVAQDVDRSQLIHTHTSGTTGAGLVFSTTAEATREQWAIWWRYRRLHGLERGTPCAQFSEKMIVPRHQHKPPFWRLDAAGHQVLFSELHMNESNLRLYAEELRKLKYPWIHGYTSLVALMAAYISETKFDLGYQPTWVTLGAENVLPSQASTIEHAFGVKPIQHYGLAEGVANISEWPDGRMIVDDDFAFVEFLPMNDGRFRIIGTNLSNSAFPLIRYDTGDIASIAPASSGDVPAGAFRRTVTSLDGRSEDYVILKDGTKFGKLDSVFKDITGIAGAQIRQTTPGSVTVIVRPGNAFSPEDVKQVRRNLLERLGEDADIAIQVDPHLGEGLQGKFRFVVSSVPGGSISSCGSTRDESQMQTNH